MGVVFRDHRVGFVLAIGLLAALDEATAKATTGTEATDLYYVGSNLMDR